ncbi:hypothetical protein KP509_23G006700 [Ceratopteris richardii]|nr:hypothetical protein KP509_23G006700 [Ceratopteris richardii]
MKGVPARTAYLQELEEVFAQFDANGDGKISAEELRSVLSSLGEDVTREEAALMVADIDSDGDGFIDLAEFVEMNRALQAASTDEEEMAAAFAIFDLRKDGKIRAEDLQQVLVRMGRAGSQLCSIEECRRMISGVDRKGLGHVDYDDFKRMMTPLVLP